MQRYKCTISYDGTHFSGYQIQLNQRTVQGELEAALAKVHKGETMKVFVSGRTDAHVHAVGQVIHFDSPLNISSQQWQKALNSLLPSDIYMSEIVSVDSSFHARFSVQSKEYWYKIMTGNERNIFKRDFVYHYPFPINEAAIQEALKYMIGTHDFTSFCSAKTEIEDKVRTIYEAELISGTDELTFRFVGSGFLYNMVRILVGTLLEVGRGTIDPNEVNGIFAKKNRMYAGKTVPGHGLYLWKVNYDN